MHHQERSYAYDAASQLTKVTHTGFVREVDAGLDAVIPLGEIDTELPLSEVYDGVEFVPEPEADSE